MNRSLKRTGLVKDGGPPRCPLCDADLVFKTDRLGRMMEQCEEGCGYRAYAGRPNLFIIPPSPGKLL